MTIKTIKTWGLFPGLALAAAVGLTLAGCESTPRGAASDSNAPPVNATKAEPDGAKLWAQNCGRCHNLRPPYEFSGNEWPIIVHHMRIRATLTAQETRAILQFLKAAK